MITIGCVCLVVFPFWETSSKQAPQPFLSVHLLTNRTVLAGYAIRFFYFGKSLVHLCSYFPSIRVLRSSIHLKNSCLLHFHLPLSQYLPPSRPVRLANRRWPYETNLYLHFDSLLTVTSLIVKFSQHYKYYITTGAAVYLPGIGIMIRYGVESSSISQIV